MMFKLFFVSVICICIFGINCDRPKTFSDIAIKCGTSSDDLAYFVEHGKAKTGKEKNIECIFQSVNKAFNLKSTTSQPSKTKNNKNGRSKRSLVFIRDVIIDKCLLQIKLTGVLDFTHGIIKCILAMVQSIMPDGEKQGNTH